ncbi:MAG: RuBisCO large subunit C-terminal-like domain-containing protein [Candidatus Alcyoniella australis]|nr:RuBisCO large subunit C-terminal-like domain-containing protein [Candidatus Alcyoniella australis]
MPLDHPIVRDVMQASERFQVRYRLQAAADDAQRIAEQICLEQTVEVVPQLAADHAIQQQIVGRIQRLTTIDDSTTDALISYPAQIADHNLPQLLNVLFGNISLQSGIRVVELELPQSMLDALPGPRFGVTGLRELVNVHDRPLLAAVLKPMGRSPSQLADYAHQFALGGIDLIKDDHGLADQRFCPFEERVERCAAAVAEANAQTGGNALYAANLIAPCDRLIQRAHRAKQLGARGLVLAPMILGLDWLRALATDRELRLPLIAHPGLSGSFVNPPQHGIAPGVLLGTLFRLAGADVSIFPSFDGRFGLSKQTCMQIAAACSAPLGDKRPSMPGPAGGVRLDNVPAKLEAYGLDHLLLVGSDLYVRSHDLTANARELVEKISGR